MYKLPAYITHTHTHSAVVSHSLHGARVWLSVLHLLVGLQASSVCSWHSGRLHSHLWPKGELRTCGCFVTGFVCVHVCVWGREGGRVTLGLLIVTYEQMLSKQSYNLELVVCIRLGYCTIQCPPPGWGEVFRVRGDLYEWVILTTLDKGLEVLPPVIWHPGQLHGLKIELVFWLQHSHIQHRVSLDASPHKRAVYSLEYNSKR